jgi:hypothetical protein
MRAAIRCSWPIMLVVTNRLQAHVMTVASNKRKLSAHFNQMRLWASKTGNISARIRADNLLAETKGVISLNVTASPIQPIQEARQSSNKESADPHVRIFRSLNDERICSRIGSVNKRSGKSA